MFTTSAKLNASEVININKTNKKLFHQQIKTTLHNVFDKHKSYCEGKNKKLTISVSVFDNTYQVLCGDIRKTHIGVMVSEIVDCGIDPLSLEFLFETMITKALKNY